eukprot:11211189-Lingulodinium_polyedra.AAC.1
MREPAEVAPCSRSECSEARDPSRGKLLLVSADEHAELWFTCTVATRRHGRLVNLVCPHAVNHEHDGDRSPPAS